MNPVSILARGTSLLKLSYAQKESDQTVSHHLTNVNGKIQFQLTSSEEERKKRQKRDGRGNVVKFLSAETKNKLIHFTYNQ